MLPCPMPTLTLKESMQMPLISMVRSFNWDKWVSLVKNMINSTYNLLPLILKKVKAKYPKSNLGPYNNTYSKTVHIGWDHSCSSRSAFQKCHTTTQSFFSGFPWDTWEYYILLPPFDENWNAGHLLLLIFHVASCSLSSANEGPTSSA